MTAQQIAANFTAEFLAFFITTPGAHPVATELPLMTVAQGLADFAAKHGLTVQTASGTMFARTTDNPTDSVGMYIFAR